MISIVAQSGEDRCALHLLYALVGQHNSRRILAMRSLDCAARLQQSAKDLRIEKGVQTQAEGFVDEVLAAVEVVLQNR